MSRWEWLWRLQSNVMHFISLKGEKVSGLSAWWATKHLEILIMMHVSVMDILDVSSGQTQWMWQPFIAQGMRVMSFPVVALVHQAINTGMKDEWRTTYLICGERRSIYLSQTWGPPRRRAADGWGSGRIWTGTHRRAPWLRSGCCSSAGVSLQGTGEEAVRCSQRTVSQKDGLYTGSLYWRREREACR